MAEYQVWLYDAFGNRVVVARDAISTLSYTLTANTVGTLVLTLPVNALPSAYIVADARLEVWRQADGGAMQREGNTAFLLQGDTVGLSSSGQRYRTLRAATLNTILDREAVLYYANTANTSKTAAADNLMKAIVRENLGTTANSSPMYSAGVTPSRDIVTPGYLAIDADVSLGPTVSKAFAWRSVLSVLQEVGRDAATAGTPVYFDVVLDNSLPTFRTWPKLRGADRTSGANQFTASADRGSLGGTIEKTVDWSQTATWVVAGGQGQDSARVLGSAFDLARVGLSPYGVRVVFVDATTLSTVGALNADASAELRKRRPAKVLTGTLQSVPGAVYGVNWNIYDRIVAEHEGDTFTARIDSVTVTLSKGAEVVLAQIKSE